jgi:hypothetical protein
MHRRFVILAGLALLGGCATAVPPIVAPAASSLGELEPLYSANAGRDAITIRVSSNGCTKKEDFAFFVERKGQAVTLAFGRKKLDPCRSFAMGHADLTFTYAELGVAERTPLFVLNPFYPWTGPGS